MAAASISLCFKGANFLSDKSGKDLANSILCQSIRQILMDLLNAWINEMSLGHRSDHKWFLTNFLDMNYSSLDGTDI